MVVLNLTLRQAAEFRGQNVGFIFSELQHNTVLTGFVKIKSPLVVVQELRPAQRRERVLKALKPCECWSKSNAGSVFRRTKASDSRQERA